jgi:hypothetical protein
VTRGYWCVTAHAVHVNLAGAWCGVRGSNPRLFVCNRSRGTRELGRRVVRSTRVRPEAGCVQPLTRYTCIACVKRGRPLVPALANTFQTTALVENGGSLSLGTTGFDKPIGAGYSVEKPDAYQDVDCFLPVFAERTF